MKLQQLLATGLLVLPLACDDGGSDSESDGSTGGTDSATTMTMTEATNTSPGTTMTTAPTSSTTAATTTTGEDTGSTTANDTGSTTAADTGGSETSTGETLQPVSIQFAARVGDEDANCAGSYADVGTDAVGGPGYTVEFRDLRFYVSEMMLVTADGTEVPVELDQDSPWQYEDVALLDFEDATGACSESGTAETNTVVSGTVPADDYTGVRFVVGVPWELNHSDVNLAESPLNVLAMSWNWLNGRKFARIEINTDNETSGATQVDQWNIHLGELCGMEDPMTPPENEEQCMRSQRPHVALDGFDPADGVIVADIAALLSGVNIAENLAGPSGCQSLPMDNGTVQGQPASDCDDLFANWGMDWETGDCVDDCASQTFFSVE